LAIEKKSDRITVGLRSSNFHDGEFAVTADFILDDEFLAENLGHLRADNPRLQIRSRTSGQRDYKLDGSIRIRMRRQDRTRE
jgi:hypothetical protein